MSFSHGHYIMQKVFIPCFILSKVYAFTSTIAWSSVNKQGPSLHEGSLQWEAFVVKTHASISQRRPFPLSPSVHLAFTQDQAVDYQWGSLDREPKFLTPTVCQWLLGTQETGDYSNCPRLCCFPPGKTWTEYLHFWLHFALPEQHSKGALCIPATGQTNISAVCILDNERIGVYRLDMSKDIIF